MEGQAGADRRDARRFPERGSTKKRGRPAHIDGTRWPGRPSSLRQPTAEKSASSMNLSFTGKRIHFNYLGAMPELSRFYGIVVRMFIEPSGKHNEPHFHAYYQEHSAVVGIASVSMLAGSLPRKQQRLVEAWAELHQEELLADWHLLLAGQTIEPIKPLE